MNRFTWFVRGYYAEGVIKQGKDVSGELAIEVGGMSAEALMLDIDILNEREDIGVVHVSHSHPN